MAFDEIMESISGQGSPADAVGHRGRFRQEGENNCDVEGVRSNTARVTDAIRIEGLPGNWGANGRYRFPVESGTCRLKSDHSSHGLKGKC